MSEEVAVPTRRRGRPRKVRAAANSRGYGYVLRKAGPKGFASLTVPKYLADQVPEGTTFQPEMTEEGILFRVVQRQEPKTISAPSWTRL